MTMTLGPPCVCWDGEHHAAEGAAVAVVAGGGVDGQHHGRSRAGPRKLTPDSVFRKP